MLRAVFGTFPYRTAENAEKSAKILRGLRVSAVPNRRFVHSAGTLALCPSLSKMWTAARVHRTAALVRHYVIENSRK